MSAGIQFLHCSHLVDNVAHSKHVSALFLQLASRLLHQTNQDRAGVFVVILVRIDHLHTILRVGPECLCKNLQISTYTMEQVLKQHSFHKENVVSQDSMYSTFGACIS